MARICQALNGDLLSGKRIARLLLTARGKEKLNWDGKNRSNENLAANMPAGRSSDLASEVRYGVIDER